MAQGAALRAMMVAFVATAVLLVQAISAQARPVSFADLAEEISPSVVNITTSTVVAGRTGPQGIVPEGSPFEEFFREFQDRQGNNDRPRRT
ncbi:MAG: serine protease, partial [Shimia sp.]|nr:serine protease [Shimia sp.]